MWTIGTACRPLMLQFLWTGRARCSTSLVKMRSTTENSQSSWPRPYPRARLDSVRGRNSGSSLFSNLKSISKEVPVKNTFASRIILSALVVCWPLACVRPAQATDLSGTITNTVTIFDDSRLVGDVTCAVPLTLNGGNPCIAFGTDHIKLRLNGHTITGGVTPPTGCSLPTDSNFGVGILVAGRADVEIQGPGGIQRFERAGILLSSSDHTTVTKIHAVPYGGA